MPDKDTTPPDHTDLSELRAAISKVLVKWNMPTRQAAISEILILFKQYAQPPVVADEELDAILTSLDAYRLNQGITTGGLSFTVEEHYAMYPELEKAKAALLQREQRLVAEARIELEAEGWMYVPPSYRDTIKNYTVDNLAKLLQSYYHKGFLTGNQSKRAVYTCESCRRVYAEKSTLNDLC